jgi:hypothetical protein
MVPRWKARIGDVVLVVVSVGLSLATIELLLYVVDTPPQFDKYTVALRELRSDAPARWSTLDSDVGVKFDNTFVSQDELDRLSSRSRNFFWLKIINTDGYHDFDEFDASIAKLSKHRFPFLGDSFTWGASADIGQSFVEIFEKQVNNKLRDGLVWNTGVPGTGTRQHYKVLERFGARMQPGHVVLGFYENDVLDNVFGMDRYFVTRSGISISRYKTRPCHR